MLNQTIIASILEVNAIVMRNKLGNLGKALRTMSDTVDDLYVTQ